MCLITCALFGVLSKKTCQVKWFNNTNSSKTQKQQSQKSKTKKKKNKRKQKDNTRPLSSIIRTIIL